MTLRGRRPGDRRVRIELVRPRDYVIAPPKRIRRPPSPAAVLIVGFLVLIAVGTVVLVLPVSSQAGTWTDPLTALFTATSAVCVTGLVVVDTGTHWSSFGHVAILGLIQVGGFGFMTGSTLILFLLVGRRTRLRDRILVQASTGTSDLGSVAGVVRRVAAFTVIAEVIGALALAVAFFLHGWDPVRAAANGVFHAVSAFNNAGLDLMGEFRSLTSFTGEPLVLGVIATLIVLGGLGFAIVGDVVGKRSWQRLALETKVVLATSVLLLVGGAAAIGVIEWSNPETLGALPATDRVTNAVFQSVTARTAGFNSVSIGGLAEATLLVTIALMFIGGASGSTAGGIKVNTFSLLLIAIVSTARGDPSATAFGRRIPHIVVYRAIAVALLSIAVAFAVALGLELVAGGRLLDVAFEAVSALATVGLTTGITPELPDQGRLLLIAAMFVGRLGPLTLVLALAARARPVSHRPAVESMRIG
ncbi:MAG TPA: potassium transporter TrkG [Candidatus Limnocylindrales bacterium]|nr:potassium transporter TrkG [Candidatus Limnocylindrales bacterium]